MHTNVHHLGTRDVKGGRPVEYVSDGRTGGIYFTYLVPRYDYTGTFVGYQAWYRRQTELFESEGAAVGEGIRTIKDLLIDRREQIPGYWRRVNTMFDLEHPERMWLGDHEFLELNLPTRAHWVYTHTLVPRIFVQLRGPMTQRQMGCE